MRCRCNQVDYSYLRYSAQAKQMTYYSKWHSTVLVNIASLYLASNEHMSKGLIKSKICFFKYPSKLLISIFNLHDQLLKKKKHLKLKCYCINHHRYIKGLRKRD